MFNFFKNKKDSKVINDCIKNEQATKIQASDLILSGNNCINLQKEDINLLSIGSAGSGKTRHFIKSNLLQANYSYIVTDCGGDCYETTSKILEKLGYEIIVLNLFEPEKSAKYNPMEYIYSIYDAEQFAQIILGDKNKFDDRFMYDMSVKLLTSLILLNKESFKDDISNMNNLNKLLEDYDLTIESLQSLSTNVASQAIKAYEDANIKNSRLFNQVSAIIKPHLDVFLCEKYKNIFNGKDELQLNKTDSKRVLYVIVPFIGEIEPIVSSIYAQAISTISTISKMFMSMGKTLEYKTIMFMDEFANTIFIPNCDQLLRNCKKHVCCAIILQDINQLKKIYPNTWEHILIAIDVVQFMGSKSVATAEYISKISHIQEQEIYMLPSEKCIIAKRGQIGLIDTKYDVNQHYNINHE